MSNLVILVVLFVFFSALVGKFPKSGFAAPAPSALKSMYYFRDRPESLRVARFASAARTTEAPGQPAPAPSTWKSLYYLPESPREARFASAARTAEAPDQPAPAPSTWNSLYYFRDGPESLRVAGIRAPPEGELALG